MTKTQTSTQTITLAVQAVARRVTQDGTPFWIIHAPGDKRFFCWNPEVAALLKVGAVVQATVRNGKHPRILAAEPASNGTAEPEAPAESSSETSPSTDPRERRMLRMSALRAAAEVLHASAVPAAELVSYAETLVSWIES